jgi:hypothetical protein
VQVLQTAGLAFGGSITWNIPKATEEYNGTTWTTGGTLNTARNVLAGVGITNSCFSIWRVIPPNTAATEEYDGTSWTTSPGSLSTARRSLGGCRNSNSSFRFWWLHYTGQSATEEWTGAGAAVTKTITVS